MLAYEVMLHHDTDPVFTFPERFTVEEGTPLSAAKILATFEEYKGAYNIEGTTVLADELKIIDIKKLSEAECSKDERARLPRYKIEWGGKQK